MNISGKRVNFISIQNSSTVAAVGYSVPPFRTGYEQVLASRVDSLYATTAKEDGSVTDIDEKYLTVLYKSGKVEVVELGIRHGTVSGTTVPHTIVSDMKSLQKFKAGDTLAYNNMFFTKDIFDPNMVSFKSGVMAKVAFWESSDTIEDGCVLGKGILDKMVTPNAYCKTMIVDFDTACHNLVKVGDILDHDSILCTLEDAVSAGVSEADPEAIAALQQLSSANPRAKTHGTVSKIETVYFGNIEDMTPTLQEIVKADDRRRAARAKALNDDSARTGQIDESIHWGGTKLLSKNVGIKIYINSELPIGSGDKVVVSNALKSTVSRVDTNDIVAEDGEHIDVLFGMTSVLKRIVKSPEISGTMNKVLSKLSTEMVNIYNKG